MLNPPTNSTNQITPVLGLDITSIQLREFDEPHRHSSTSTPPSLSPPPASTMASTKPLAMLCRPSTQLLRASRTSASSPWIQAAAAFSTAQARYATPTGPPPSKFRLARPERWNESKTSALDQAGQFFLLTEMARGMYVVLEQFFRPP